MRRDVRHERKSKVTYYSWKASFVIVLRDDDNEVIELIKERFGVGNITYSQSKIRYQISDSEELYSVIVPFFIKNRLHGKKGKDFELWSDALEIINKYKKIRGKVTISKGKKGFQKIAWQDADIKRLNNLHQEITKYKSKMPQERKWIENTLGRE